MHISSILFVTYKSPIDDSDIDYIEEQCGKKFSEEIKQRIKNEINELIDLSSNIKSKTIKNISDIENERIKTIPVASLILNELLNTIKYLRENSISNEN